MPHPSQQKWDAIYQKRSTESLTPAQVLSGHSHLLPDQGCALDLACGLGANALLLAKHGLNVDAFDISAVAIDKLKQNVTFNPLINALVCDILNYPLERNTYDIIVVSRFLERSLAPKLIRALKPEGLIFYQTFTQKKVSTDGPSNPAFLLAKNELQQLFSSLSLIYYHEEGFVGDTNAGFRNEAMLIAQKAS
ncbi:MAG: hypothetical protein A6F71_03825 [Cycloclasticus sp. symbiont of Poecilosclerida sp. M]|nr:MAG: hypothetical protein A6F71_03825 [Cycloclasticus sp. symbiont of Poecilosclerida sp. M]